MQNDHTTSFSGTEFTNHSVQEKLKLAAFAISFIVESNLNLIALKLEEAGKINLVDRSANIIIAFTIQIIYFVDIPDFYSFIGIGLVLLAIVVVGAKSLCRNKYKNVVQSKTKYRDQCNAVWKIHLS